MAKKKGKVIQMLSPENYIRQKVRTLPIHECLITSDWKESKKVSIVVTRKHSNGNFTFCAYLVDLLCLGIKDAWFDFNISSVEYEEFRDRYFEMSEGLATTTDYSLVHNIIYAAWEFAEEIGFQPCKDFVHTCQFMLEDDSDDIELKEIECGDKGKPLYIPGEEDTEFEISKVLTALEHNVGRDNFEVILPYFDKDNEEDDSDFMDAEDTDFESFNDIFTDEEGDFQPTESDFQLFAELVNAEQLTEEEEEQFNILTNSIAYNLVDADKMESYYDDFCFEVEKYQFTSNIVSNETLGVTSDDYPHLDELKELFDKSQQEDITQKELSRFYKISQGLPCHNLVKYQREVHLEHSDALLDQMLAEFPDYPLFKLLDLPRRNFSDFEPKEYRSFFNLDTFFKGRTYIEDTDLIQFFATGAMLCTIEGNLERLLCLAEHLFEMPISFEFMENIEKLINKGMALTIVTVLSKENNFAN